MKLFFIFCLAFICVNSEFLNKEFVQEKWTLFKDEFLKEYNSEIEEEMRQKIFTENLMLIHEHNEKYRKNLVTYEMGVNQFTDKLHSEYVDEMLSRNDDESVDDDDDDDDGNDDENDSFYMPESNEIPDEIDWVKEGAVTNVKTQGKCGGCYAFATTGLLEAANWKANGQLVSLSEQNIIDCSRRAGNIGCDGGFTLKALNYIIKNKGIDTEKSYPFQAVHMRCRFKVKQIGARVESYKKLPKGDEETMKNVVGNGGPIAIAINAEHPSFQHYKNGVFYEENCNKTINHAMLIVGYGTINNIEYWKVKNSWGSTWGDRGYILMARNKNNHCGIAAIPVFAIAKSNK